MRERMSFEQELSALARGTEVCRELQLGTASETRWGVCIGNLFATGAPSDGTVSDPEALAGGKPVVLHVRFYPGRVNESALVFGGVHGNEDEGVVVTKAIRSKLELAYGLGRKARYATFLIENVRADRDLLDPSSKNARWVEGVEPNRNFPLPGEGLGLVTARRKRLGFGLVDPDTRRFPDQAPRAPTTFPDVAASKDKDLKTDRTSKDLLAETRLLLKLVGCIQPTRAVSAHSHSISKKRGDAPGVFVDPRGGFDSDLDAPLTAEGRVDDALADAVLRAAKTRIAASKLTVSQQREALAGNRMGITDYLGETVHYSFGARKARGTSFGMWAPAPITGQPSDDRPGIQTLTLEMPKWLVSTKLRPQVDELAGIWADAIIERFLEVK